MIRLVLAVILISVASLFAAGEGHDHGDHKDHDHKKHDDHKGHDHHDNAAHGGDRYKLGKLGEVEFVHNEAKGSVQIYVFKKGLKEKLILSRAPRLNVTLEKGRKQVKTIAIDGKEKSSSFAATHDVLKGHREMAISIKVDGKSYVIKVAHDHGKHDDHDHK